jgi:hypothetical protein
MKPISFLLIFLCTSGPFKVTGQAISGSVTAFKNIPLRNAVIKSSKTGKSVLSDSAGIYHIESAPDDILFFTAAGFKDKKCKTGKNSVINIDLKYLYGVTSFDEAVANNHFTSPELKKILEKYPAKGVKDYSRYQNIYELIRGEITNVRIDGTNVYSVKAASFSLSSQVLYVVNETIISDISFVLPANVKKIEYLEDSDASYYGMRGANGVIKITLKN